MHLSNIFALLASTLAVSAIPQKRAICSEASKTGLLTTQTSPWVPGQSASLTWDYTCTIQERGVPKVSDFYLVSSVVSSDGNGLYAYLGRVTPDVSAASPVDSFTLAIPDITFSTDATYTLHAQFTYDAGGYDQVLFDQITITTQSTAPPTAGTTIRPGNAPDMCLAAEESNGSPVSLEPCNGDPNQAWAYAGAGTGTAISIYGGAFCLDVTNGNTTPGQALQVYACGAGNANQEWYVTSDNRIAWENQGECVDLTNGVTTAGNVVQVWSCTDGDSYQVWNFV